MSWREGSDIFRSIAEVIANRLDDDNDRKAIYEDLVGVFAEYDCDNLTSSVGVDSVLDEVLEALLAEDSEENPEE